MIKLLFSYLLGGISTGIISVISTILMTRMLSTEVYGKGMMFESLVDIFSCICILGMDQVFARFFYEQQYKENLSLLLYRCLFLVFLSAMAASLFLFLLGPWLLQWLKIDNLMIIPLIIVGMILVALLRFTELISRLRENSTVFNLSVFLVRLFALLTFIIVFFLFKTGYWAIITSSLIAMAVVVTGLLILYKKEFTFPSRPFFTISNTKELSGFLHYGMPLFFSIGLTWLFVNLDKFFLLHWSNYQELGIYTAAFSLTAPLTLAQSTFSIAWVPRMNQMLIHAPFKSKKIFFLTFEQLSFTLTCLFLLSIACKEYLILFVGPDFYQAVNILPYLFFAPYFMALSEVVVAGLVKSKRSDWTMYIALFAVIMNALCCWIFVPMWGAAGAGISVAITYGVVFVIRWRVAFRYYRFKINVMKLITYISFICIFIPLSDIQTLKYPLLLLMLGMMIVIEKHWLFHIINKHYLTIFFRDCFHQVLSITLPKQKD